MVAGIDGCKAGWLMIYGNHVPKIQILRDISEIDSFISAPFKVFIDIPIGLPSKEVNRIVEAEARRLLGKRSSTVFNVPCREAVYSKSYHEANEVNKNTLGKGLSIQSWNIVGKIREVDQLLTKQKSLRSSFFECHPEICFHLMNPANSVLSSKKTETGQMERLHILKSYVSEIQLYYKEFVSRFSKSEVATDDIMDALVLWITALRTSKSMASKLVANKRDAYGINMNMSFINPHGKEF